MKELTHIHFVARNYQMLQGLRLVPFGFYFLFMAFGEMSGIPALAQGRLDYRLLLLFVAGVLYKLAGLHYARVYGQVAALPKSAHEKLLANWPIILFVAGIVLDVLLALPISFLGIFLSIYFLMPFVAALPVWRLHYLLASLFLLFLSLAPLLVDESLQMAFFAPAGAYFLLGLGLTLVVVGIVDHVWLRNFMGPEGGA